MAAVELYLTPFFNDANLVSYWRLEGNSNDAKNGNHGTDISIVYGAEYGLFNLGAYFAGVVSEISNFLGLSMPLSNFTISVWFKTTTASGKKIIGVENLAVGQGATAYDRTIYVGTDGKLYFAVYPGSIQTLSTPGVVTDGLWHHAVLSVDGTTSKAYFDGYALSGSMGISNQSAAIYLRIGSWKLGGWPAALDGYFTGSLDDIAVFSRALTADEVLSLFSGPAVKDKMFLMF